MFMYDSMKLLTVRFPKRFFNASIDASLEINVEILSKSFSSNNYQVLKNIVGDDGKKLYSDLAVTAMNL